MYKIIYQNTNQSEAQIAAYRILPAWRHAEQADKGENAGIKYWQFFHPQHILLNPAKCEDCIQ